MLKIVVALGGNALQTGNVVSAQDQYNACLATAETIVSLASKGHKIAVVHGNGPQVGEVIAVSELANKYDAKHTLLPFDCASSYTQGYIGYHLQNAINYKLHERKVLRQVATIITQVEVNAADPAFTNPSKPIGSFFTKNEADLLVATQKYVMKEDAGRGFRRVVPSPKPVDIVEKNIINNLFNDNVVTICCGGGGIPVCRSKDNGKLEGVAAVIDKDATAAKLAEQISADKLVILTAVDKVSINYNKPNQLDLSELTVSDAKKYIEEGHFAPGSMLPKIQAAINFLESNPKATVIITSLANAESAIEGKGGTKIVK